MGVELACRDSNYAMVLCATEENTRMLAGDAYSDRRVGEVDTTYVTSSSEYPKMQK